jgi:hypothetical protein
LFDPQFAAHSAKCASDERFGNFVIRAADVTSVGRRPGVQANIGRKCAD